MCLWNTVLSSVFIVNVFHPPFPARIRDPRTNRLSPNSVVAWKQSSPSPANTVTPQVVPPAPAPPPYSLIHYYCGNPMVEVTQGKFHNEFVLRNFVRLASIYRLLSEGRDFFFCVSTISSRWQEFSTCTRQNCYRKNDRKWFACCPSPPCWLYTIS